MDNLKMNQQTAKSYFESGKQLRAAGKINPAIKNIKRAIDLNKQEGIWFHLYLGSFFAEQGMMDEAIASHQYASLLVGWHLCKEKNYHFLRQGWFAGRLTDWIPQVKNLVNAPEINVLEIGSFEGMSACWLLDTVLTHPSSKITCIDPNFQEVFDDNIAKTGSAQKVNKLTAISGDILGSLSVNSYDLIYIDGDHTAAGVLQDAFLCWNLAKVGSLIIFDDYKWKPHLKGTNQTPMVAVDIFLSLFNDKIKIVRRGYQVMVRKLSDDVDNKVTSTLAEIAYGTLKDVDSTAQVNIDFVLSKLSEHLTKFAHGELAVNT